ncbi:MAG: hypothetical protein ABIK28_09395 [Planctomycetota bacterium]
MRINEFNTARRRTFTMVRLFALLMTGSVFPCCQMLEEKPIKLNIEACTYPADRQTKVSRVLVLPFNNESGFPKQGEMVEQTFSRALAEQGQFEVISLPSEDHDLMESLDPYKTGRFSLSMLIELGQWYNVDAVMLGCIKTYNPYCQPRIGMKADLISIRSGAVLRAVDGTLDSGEDMVAHDIIRYFEENHNFSHEESLFEWRSIIQSPKMFARYACHRFVNELYRDQKVAFRSPQ